MVDQNHGTRAIPQRPLGRTGAKVSALGLGGHHLGDLKTLDETIGLVHEAVDAGITFFANCWEYYVLDNIRASLSNDLCPSASQAPGAAGSMPAPGACARPRCPGPCAGRPLRGRVLRRSA